MIYSKEKKTTSHISCMIMNANNNLYINLLIIKAKFTTVYKKLKLQRYIKHLKKKRKKKIDQNTLKPTQDILIIE